MTEKYLNTFVDLWSRESRKGSGRDFGQGGPFCMRAWAWER